MNKYKLAEKLLKKIQRKTKGFEENGEVIAILAASYIATLCGNEHDTETFITEIKQLVAECNCLE